MTTDTPRTDAEVFEIQDCNGQLRKVITTQFAKQLERELAHSLENQVKAQAEVEELQQQKRNCLEIIDDDAIEIAELKAANERLTEALESCWHSANTYDGDYTAACDNVMHIVNATLKIANPEDK